MKKIFALLLALAMVFAFFSCGKVQAEAVTVRMIALKGPTGMGVSKLMADNDDGATKNKYNFTIAAAPTEVSAAVIGEKVDFAAMPVSLASVLINKGADISLVAVNTLGVLYVLENGNEVTDIASLKGKTIYSTGAGATPQYVLEYILEKNGIDPEKDVTIEYLSEHAELAAKLAAGEVSIGVLPEPNVRSALINGKGNLRIALDITSEWDKVSTSKLAQGCIVVSNKFRREHPEAYKAVVSELAASVEYVNANKLSIGTIDQLYLSLRLSAMQEITKEKMPIILDETFAYYDNQRLENILTYINEELKENQVIIFTCSNREKEILEKNNIKFNYINI